MSIDNIQLDGYLCYTMFSKSLLLAEKPNISKPLPQKQEITSLGENQSQILFLVNNSEHKFLADDEMKMLSGLLTACKISMADIALVNYHHHQKINYKHLTDHFQSKKLLIFGVNAQELDLPFTIPFFQVQQFQEQTYLLGPALSELINNVPLKTQLWGSLKKIFL